MSKKIKSYRKKILSSHVEAQWFPIQFSLLIQNYLFMCNRINIFRAKTVTWVETGHHSVGNLVKI